MDQADPYGFIAGQHFNEVLKRYGAPVIILNLVKVNNQFYKQDEAKGSKIFAIIYKLSFSQSVGT